MLLWRPLLQDVGGLELARPGDLSPQGELWVGSSWLRFIPSNQGGELMKEEEDGKGSRSYEDEVVGDL